MDAVVGQQGEYQGGDQVQEGRRERVKNGSGERQVHDEQHANTDGPEYISLLVELAGYWIINRRVGCIFTEDEIGSTQGYKHEYQGQEIQLPGPAQRNPSLLFVHDIYYKNAVYVGMQWDAMSVARGTQA